MSIEAYLHEQGYSYTGPGNLYQVTFFELASLSEGRRLLSLITDGVTGKEEEELDRMAAALENA